MECVVERFSESWDQPVSGVQLACCSSHYGLSWRSKDLLVYSTTDSEAPLHLTGHHNNVSALAFGGGTAPLLLCSASEDYVIMWDIGRCYRQVRKGEIPSGLVVGTLLGKVVHLSLCPLNERVAVCSGSRVVVLNAKKEEVLTALSGHLGPVTASGFCPWETSRLVSISEDRTFKIWNLQKEEILYQSSVLSGCPLLSLFFLNERRQLVTGSADGMVWCYALPDDRECCLVTKIDLHKLEQRHRKRMEGSDKHHSRAAGPCETQRGEVEIARPVLRIWGQTCLCGPASMQLRDDEVWIGSSDGLYLLDLATSELLVILHFKDFPNLSVSIAGSLAASQGHSNSMYCLVTSLFEAKVALLDVDVTKLDRLCLLLENTFPGKESLSALPSSPPVPTSPLNAELKKRDPTAVKKTGVKNHALVFHTAVKSSGYTASPQTMFTPKTNIKKKSTTTDSMKDLRPVLSEYPLHPAAPHVLQTQLAVSTTPVHCLQYSVNAKRVLCGLGDGTVLMYKSSFTGSPAVYAGHNKPVSSVCWSHSRQWFLTASEDRTVSLWPTDVTQAVLTMGSERHSTVITGVQFYYLDKFILLGCGASLLLYLYHLDKSKNDIKRYEQKSTFKLSSKFSTFSGTEITAVSAVNDFFSYIVLAAGADRSIQVFDMNRSCVATKICDAHSRAVHHLCQNKGSMFSAQDLEGYSLFLSSAVTDGVKLWDLRTTRCVRRYGSHLNRCHRCTAAISPCGRYIATGSEDNCAYVYDIRSSSFLYKLQRQTDTILNVTFNPATPELLTGTMDGKLAVFRPGDGAPVNQV